LPQLYSPLSQLRHQQLLHQQPLQPQQQVLLQKLKLRRTKRSLQKVSLLRKTHLKQTQSQLHQPLSNRSLDDNDDLIIDDEVTFGRNLRARDFGKLVHEDVELSDHVKFRLWLARQLALMKLQEVRG
jgi:hypothetical protein